MNEVSGSKPTPEPGNIAICWSCVEFAEYGPDLQLLKIEDERYGKILADSPELRAALLTVWAMRRMQQVKQARQAQLN